MKTNGVNGKTKNSKQNKLGRRFFAVEGMPGAGKTSSLLELIPELQEEFILLSETNPEPNANWQDREIEDQTKIYHQIWFDRMTSAELLSKKLNSIFLFDRTYFSNLAFKYALDVLSGSHSYSSYLNLYKQDLEEKKFSLIIILDVHPTIGYQRRLSLGNPIPYPWSEKQFLEAFRKFYLEELPKITSTPHIFINTDFLSLSEVKIKILEILTSYSKCQGKTQVSLSTCEAEELLLDFGKKHQLGAKHSKLVNVFGCPTLYFSQHSIQIVDGAPVFINNERLREVLFTE